MIQKLELSLAKDLTQILQKDFVALEAPSQLPFFKVLQKQHA
jgi:hypothetical protein